jgi:thymidine kinase
MSINLITGCMFSGKTSALIDVAKKSKLLGKKVIIVNYEHDTRYSDNDKVMTHSGDSFECIPCAKDLLFMLKDNTNVTNADVICINEGQFFENLVNFCVNLSELGKTIHVCGLDGDYLRRPFGEILNLIPLCDTYVKLYALCMSCKNGNCASFTKKITNSNDLIEIGSTEMYIPVCRKCYNL